MERFNRTLKEQVVFGRVFKNVTEVRAAVADFVKIYNERAAKANPGQVWIKRVVAEMGGKDAIIVDDEADLEAARKDAFEKAQAALRDEVNGAGVGSLGKGGKRSSGVSKDALKDMPLADLKKLISQE